MIEKDIEVVITRGVPGSGKSTWAQEWVSSDPQNRVRVNLDDIRMEKYGKYVLLTSEGKVDRERESIVYSTAIAAIERAVANDKSVVYDATNLTINNYGFINNAAVRYKRRTGKSLLVSVKDFPLSYEEALRRNAVRSKSVPISTLRRMFNRLGPNGEFRHIDGTYPVRKFVRPTERQQAICFDMDGTLVDVRDVRHFVNPVEGKHRNFDSFHRFSLYSPPNQLVVNELTKAVEAGFAIVITTARQETYREVSQKWLDDNGIHFDNMFMRSNKDHRSDYLVKIDMLKERVLPNYDPLRFFDDNPQAIQAWVENGMSVSTIPFVDQDNSHIYEGKELPLSRGLFVEGVCLRCDRPISKGFIGPECTKLR